MKLVKKLTKKLRKRLKMDEPQKKKLESDFLILLLAFVVVEVVFVMMLMWPLQKFHAPVKSFKKVAYYPAPLEAAKIPGNPQITPVAVGELPSGFPANIPFYESSGIQGAFRSGYPGDQKYLAVVVFKTNKSAYDVLSFYEKWFIDHAWGPVVRQPSADDPRSLYVRQKTRSFSVSTTNEKIANIVTISYADEK